MFHYDLIFILALSLPVSFATHNGPIDARLLQEDGLILADSSGHVTVYEGSGFEEVESEVGTKNNFESGSVTNTTFTDLEGFKNDWKNNYTSISVISGDSDVASTPPSIIVAVVILVVALICGAVVVIKLLYDRYFKQNTRKDPADYDSDEYSVMMTWD
ncbi:uncharacterized protein LOC110467164 [Mizuhopecten yessoensis]|uniref:uncharacterized protein LOC110467164 n=1 Tax=Mizuhopecten yessoensis TaxID=6573 RepID=UPI000B45B48B|nr:uncharacterized protein LOC110467164 [Mizuhopecten yessoensis]